MVSASDPGGDPVVVLLDPKSDGVTRTDDAQLARGHEATYEFTDAPVLGVLGAGAAEVLRCTRSRACCCRVTVCCGCTRPDGGLRQGA